MIITIDGPVASGKSTISKLLADRLDYYYINSGLLYRSVAYIFIFEYGYTDKDLYNIAYQEVKDFFLSKKISYSYVPNNGASLLFNKSNITPYLKDTRVENSASIVAKNLQVRQAILEYQRTLADDHNIIAEGRDTGTVVFPDAEFKFFITACLIERTKRWINDTKRLNNKNISFEESLEFIRQRDQRDIKRPVAPLKPALNAIIIDNSNMTIEETLNFIINIIKDKKPNK